MATLPEGVGYDAEILRIKIPTNTFLIDASGKQIAGMDDGLAAMRQAVDIILNTERFRWQIYSSNFGVELEELIGEEYDYIISEMPRRIRDAFSVDDRISSAENFVFEQNGSNLTCRFDVITVFGTLPEEVVIT